VRADAYLADPAGAAHVRGVLRARAAAAGRDPDVAPAPDDEHDAAVALFAGSHDVVVARRHLVDGARYDDELAGAGTLTPLEHERFLAMTVDTMRDLYASRPQAKYVAAFQNWLRPAGASFDHLHKQVVAIDEYGPQVERERVRLVDEPDLYQTQVIDVATRHGLVVAANEHAVAIAGVGHRYPAFEVYSTGREQLPWEHDEAQLRGVSDLLHALHAASGVHTASNEEWHHRPPDVAEPMPFRIVLKWRISTLAGFEGVTKVYVNTIDPYALRERAVARLRELRESGLVAPMRIGDEAGAPRLAYAG
jgi:galactose-1-phosphate uridylyltransferase